MKSLLVCCLGLAACAGSAFGQLSGTNPVARFHTDSGDIDVLLLQDVAPNNVLNFLAYVTQGFYDNSFIHRSISNFVIQGGGYKFVNGSVKPIGQGPAVINEFHVSNTRGTLAMAKLPNDPNSATNQWFFNESDSNAGGSNGLDTQDGGFTVFGRIMSSSGLTTMDTIGALHTIDADGPSSTTFDNLPVVNYSGGTLTNSNLIHVIWIKVVPQVVSVTRLNATTIRVQGRGTASTTYKLQSSATSANGSGFTTSVNVTTGSGGTFTYDDTTAGAKKFYRLVIP